MRTSANLVICKSFYLAFVLWAAVLLSHFCFCQAQPHCVKDSCRNFSNISYPFGLADSHVQGHPNGHCGHPDFQVLCNSGTPHLAINGVNYTIVGRPSYNPNKITLVNDAVLTNSVCGVPDASVNLSHSPFSLPSSFTFQILHIGCSQADIWPVSLCNNSIVNEVNPVNNLLNCKSFIMVPIPIKLTILPEEIEKALRKGFDVLWNETDEAFESCRKCTEQSGFCGFNESNRFVCYYPHEVISSANESSPVNSNNAVPRKKSNNAVLIGVGIGASVCLLMFAAFLFRVFHRRRLMTVHKRLSPTSNVERFLEEYIHEMPTRYSYHQLQKITNNFAAKVGEGGFGVVFKGKLSKGTFVAVKILHPSSHSESQFINEVATIGRIHHVNLVRLMGYCFDGSKSALVYEFMVNGSLEKFIFSENGKNHILSWEQSYSIAVGAARGMSYLHQDCQSRIIHFDIKPHNILLDEDFTPKIADFGLAKICGRGEDYISLTGTRGTLGYAAPEICSKSLGPVTEKSDVYSFGMLLLEIVGARKNIDVRVSRSSQLYFPDWVFKLMQNGKLEMILNGRGRGEIGCEDELKAKRLTKVGLWCIQYSSTDRPSMSKVVQMLEGNGEDVSTPPMPFNSSITSRDTVSESSSS